MLLWGIRLCSANTRSGHCGHQLSRHRIGERFVVRARSLLGGLHHEYLLAPAMA